MIQQIQVSTHGAELQSLVANGQEYLWQGDSKFWGRRAPILFPIVGRLANDTLRIDGREYTMKQHGFARDAEFVQRDGIYVLEEDGSRDNFPYAFELAVKYTTQGNTLICDWKVTNSDDKIMYFQIGAHPAFLLPDYIVADEIHGYIQCYDAEGKRVYPMLLNGLEDGLRVPFSQPKSLVNDEAILALTNNTFENDAILIEGNQVAKVALLNKHGKKVLTVSCAQAESFGLWAPNKPACPFVCIEPWCGIADRKGFILDISKRNCIYNLAPDKMYIFNYSISIAE